MVYQQNQSDHQDLESPDTAITTEQLIELYPRVWQYCLSKLQNLRWAEDAAQETMLRIWEMRHAYQKKSTLWTWAHSVARNVIREFVRSHITYGIKVVTNQTPDMEESEDQYPDTEGLASCVDMVSERQKEAIRLRFFQNHSLAQLAKSMDCRIGTVKATLHKGLGELRQIWNERIT